MKSTLLDASGIGRLGAISKNKKNKKWFIVMAIVLVCFAFRPPQAGAETWQERQKLLASDGAARGQRAAAHGAASYGSTGTGCTFQISLLYSAMLRSLENFPEPATFRMALYAHPSGSAYKSHNC